MAVRKIVKIDEERCDGCGQCVPACAENAIEIVNGKARLASESCCDGLGACLGECPQDAITIEKREAAEFDEEEVARRAAGSCPAPGAPPAACELVDLEGERTEGSSVPSRLENWPLQLKLAPTGAPWLQGADLVIAADCVPAAFPDFHRRFLGRKKLLIGCPKLDSAEFYRKKLAQIFSINDIGSIDVVYMEVPCCFGLVHLVHESLKESGKEIPLTLHKVGIKGDVIETSKVGGGGS